MVTRGRLLLSLSAFSLLVLFAHEFSTEFSFLSNLESIVGATSMTSAPVSKHYSLWFVPKPGALHSQLQDEITSLSQRIPKSSKPFTPHVTLIGAVECSEEARDLHMSSWKLGSFVAGFSDYTTVFNIQLGYYRFFSL